MSRVYTYYSYMWTSYSTRFKLPAVPPIYTGSWTRVIMGMLSSFLMQHCYEKGQYHHW